MTVVRFELEAEGEDDGGGAAARTTTPRATVARVAAATPSTSSKAAASLDVEDALDLVGTGPYQLRALITTGLANAADAAEILAIGLVIPAAREQLHLDAHPAARAALTSCIFLGMLCGGLIFGPLGDRLGRRATLISTLVINGACGALSALSPTAAVLAAFRFFAGVGVGGSVPVVFSWLAEVVPRRERGRWLVFLAAFWMVGSLYGATLGLILIPRLGWRVFLLAATAPAWGSAACALLLMDESPRFSLTAGRTEQAERALRRMGELNGRPLPARFSLAALPRPPPPTTTTTSTTNNNNVNTLLAPFRQLLCPPLRSRTLPLLVGMAGISGGWYSLILWLPTFFERRGAAVSDGRLYVQTLAVSAANLPGNVASALLVDRLGRRLTACGSMALAALAALAFALAPPTPTFSLLAACVFNGVSVAGWNALDCLLAECYPTSVRASAVGLLGAAGRLASFAATALAGTLTEVSLALPLLVAAGLLAAGSAAMLRLPEPALQPLEDVVGGGGDGNGGGGGGGEGLGPREEEEGEGASLLLGGGGGSGSAASTAGAVVALQPLSSAAVMR
jgi:MFS family permease